MFFSGESKKAFLAVQELAQNLEETKRALSELRKDVGEYLERIEAGQRELRSSMERQYELGRQDGRSENPWIDSDEYRKVTETLGRELLSMKGGLEEVDKRLASTREDILNLKKWTSTAERDMKAIREQIDQAVTEIKNKVSYVLFRLKK